MRGFTAYQLLKHSKLLDPAIAEAGSVDAGRLARLKQAGIELVDAFRGNVTLERRRHRRRPERAPGIRADDDRPSA